MLGVSTESMPSGLLPFAPLADETNIDKTSRKQIRPRTRHLTPLVGCGSISGKRQKASRRREAGGLLEMLRC
jgi:hypothetical protein